MWWDPDKSLWRAIWVAGIIIAAVAFTTFKTMFLLMAALGRL